MEFEEYLLTRQGYQQRLKVEQGILKFQTALICEAFVGSGKGAKFVNDAWSLEPKEEMTADVVKAKLKAFRERQMRK